jgi:hypothetical protein
MDDYVKRQEASWMDETESQLTMAEEYIYSRCMRLRTRVSLCLDCKAGMQALQLRCILTWRALEMPILLFVFVICNLDFQRRATRYVWTSQKVSRSPVYQRLQGLYNQPWFMGLCFLQPLTTSIGPYQPSRIQTQLWKSLGGFPGEVLICLRVRLSSGSQALLAAFQPQSPGGPTERTHSPWVKAECLSCSPGGLW